MVTGDLGFDRGLGVHQEESIRQKEHLHETVGEGKAGQLRTLEGCSERSGVRLEWLAPLT